MHINPWNTLRTRKFGPVNGTYKCPKLTFAETISYALTWKIHFKRTFKAHKVEIEEHTWVNQLLENIDNMQKALEKSTEARKKNDAVVNASTVEQVKKNNCNPSNSPVGRKRKAEKDETNVKSNQSLN